MGGQEDPPSDGATRPIDLCVSVCHHNSETACKAPLWGVKLISVGSEVMGQERDDLMFVLFCFAMSRTQD